ncbi:agouti signaling protein 1 [Hippocampus comes]|nr:PREDICTED: agouti-signaling protein [Hippocampus comes]XP_019716064.1 PREDICTED: agouti-signaling protein [Hippocampus comes]
MKSTTRMRAVLLLASFVFTASHYSLGTAHMLPDDTARGNKAAISNTIPEGNRDANAGGLSAPVLIVELPKSGRKKKAKKNKLGRRRRPPPPAGCVPLWGSCKSEGKVCCDFCALCHCRIFRTVCYCRMGNPQC